MKQGIHLNKNLPIFNRFLIRTFLLEDYIALDEGVMTTYFQMWIKEEDCDFSGFVLSLS